MANKEFTAKQENIVVVNECSQSSSTPVVSSEELENELLIPRRPKIEKNCSPETLKQLENENYLKWRRKIAVLQEKDDIVLTPFEKNLEFWRQLWRVVERSDILIQILDARNPLLFYCEDLDKYIKEVDQNKISVILLNKSDYLTKKQRKYWFDYFSSVGKKCLFFSALEQQMKIDQIQNNEDSNLLNEIENLNLENDFPMPLGYDQLISYLKSLKNDNADNDNKSTMTVGFVGFPNVGKSSTINALLRAKRVSVSATPGKTKHFQTFILDNELTICDCPGLVFPNIASSKTEMIINGILPIDQIKDSMMAIDAITEKIPAHIFESLYGLILKKPGSDQDSNRNVSSLELLTVYGYSRGFMTQRGLPDTSKSAKFILKDFVTGKLLYCYAPPNVKQDEYHQYINKITNEKEITDKKLIRIYEGNNLINKNFDQEYFEQKFSTAHVKDPRKNILSTNVTDNKPWKKHNKRNKREKLRRVFAHLDN